MKTSVRPASRNTSPLAESIMRLSPRVPSFASKSPRSASRWLFVTVLLSLLASIGVESGGQSAPGPLVSRADLTAAANRAEIAATTGDPDKRAQNAVEAAAIRQRLRDGDFQVGDRVVVRIVSDAVHRDTVVVRSDRSIELPGMIVVSVVGVLRSELEQRVSTEVLKYVKAQQIDVTPLIRVGVMGAVSRPGYFAFASDMPITDAIMGAGGPTGTADVGRTIVRRQNQEYRSAGETSKAISSGLTLDQFGLSAGDELVVGQRREFGATTLIGLTGALASVLALVVAMHGR
jgi:protein involved in polysaccharide export with SLBB domain